MSPYSIRSLILFLTISSLAGTSFLKAMDHQHTLFGMNLGSNSGWLDNAPNKCVGIISVDNPVFEKSELVKTRNTPQSELYLSTNQLPYYAILAHYDKQASEYTGIYTICSEGKSTGDIQILLKSRLSNEEAFKFLKTKYEQQRTFTTLVNKVKNKAVKRSRKASYKPQRQALTKKLKSKKLKNN